MKKGKIISILVMGALIGTFSLTYISKTKDSVSEDMLNEEAVAVLVEKLSKGDYGDKIKYSGTLGYGEEKNIVSMIDEKVTYVGAKKGQYVEKGQVLVKFDSSKIDGNVEKSKKAYEDALAKSEKSLGKLDGLEKEIENKKIELENNKDRLKAIEKRLEELKAEIIALEESKKNGTITEEVYLVEIKRLNEEMGGLNIEKVKVNGNIKRYELEIPVTEKSIESLKKIDLNTMQVQSTKKMYDEMLKMKENYVVKAPTSGKVTSINAYVGEKVENKMMPLVTIGREDVLSFNFNVDSDERDGFKVGDTFDVYVEKDGKEIKERGTVRSISKQEDMRTGRYGIKVEVNNNKYKINSYASLYKVIDDKDSTNMVSKNSLVREEEGNFVYIVKDGVAKKTEVKLGRENNDSVEISKGLNRDDLVIVKGKEFIEDGEKVEVMEANS